MSVYTSVCQNVVNMRICDSSANRRDVQSGNSKSKLVAWNNTRSCRWYRWSRWTMAKKKVFVCGLSLVHGARLSGCASEVMRTSKIQSCGKSCLANKRRNL